MVSGRPNPLRRLCAAWSDIRRAQGKRTMLPHAQAHSRKSLNITNAIPVRRRTRAGMLFDTLVWFVRHDHKLLLLQNGLVLASFTSLRVTWVRLLRRVYDVGPSIEATPSALFSARELEEQRAIAASAREPLFSVVVPLYNTPEEFLRPMIQSVLDQTHPHWELCMADGSDANHPEVERICREYASADPRVRYRRLDCNLGISGNTNECLRMATGDYVALFDHDDMLHPAALFEIARAIHATGADFVYTDECVFSDVPGDIRTPHYKPAFAPFNLLANNYVCHLSVCERRLLERVGSFCSECDGSQDHDMILRITRHATRIAHIPEVLYYWRAHPASAAHSASAKPYAVKAGVRAVERHLARTGQHGSVAAIRPDVPIYRVRYEIVGMPKISVIMAVWGDRRAFWKSLRSVLRTSTWPNLEAVVLDCGNPHGMLERSERMYGRDVRVVHLARDTSYPRAVRVGVAYSMGEYLALLAPDLVATTTDWVQELLMFAQRPDVGAVGGKVVSDTRATIRQAGLCLGVTDPAASYFGGIVAGDALGYMGRLAYAQNVSAVSAECMMMRREVWDAMGGMDPTFDAKHGDTDLCMRMRVAGLQVIWTPFAEWRGLTDPLPKLYGHWAAGLDSDKRTFERAVENDVRFRKRWERELRAGDPYYNPNLLIDHQDFAVFPATWIHDARLYSNGPTGHA